MKADSEQIRQFLSSHPRKEIDEPGLVRAGVLMLFFKKNGELHVLLTKRTADVEHHKSQVSFPGGSVDRGDADVIETALRETEEEIGLGRQQVEVLGLFDDVWTPSGFAITPVIGFAESLPALSPNAIEVEEILGVPVSFFLDPQNERTEKRERGGKMFDLYFYNYGGTEIWGATAGMLRSFLHSLKEFKSYH